MQHEGSFFRNILELVEKYELPPPNEMKHISKEQWKIQLKKTFRCYWTEHLQREAGEKSMLKCVHLDIMHRGTSNPVRDTVMPNRMDVM